MGRIDATTEDRQGASSTLLTAFDRPRHRPEFAIFLERLRQRIIRHPRGVTRLRPQTAPRAGQRGPQFADFCRKRAQRGIDFLFGFVLLHL